jgi:16S rRNA (guanine966-N2)-methyltransferase
MFNIIAGRVEESTVLDLFAGTGALGIEAVSRGARSAVFIDNQKNACRVILKNIDALKITDCSTVIRWNITKSINCLNNYSVDFTLVFMDPPYHQGWIHPTLLGLHKSQSLKKDAWIVIEHADTEPFDEPPYFSVSCQRRYGKTLVSILKYMI